MVLDERMGVSEPAPTGAARFYCREVLPHQVPDQDGKDVTARIGPGRWGGRGHGRLTRSALHRAACEVSRSDRWTFDEPARLRPRQAGAGRRRLGRVPLLPDHVRRLAGRRDYDAPTLAARGARRPAGDRCCADSATPRACRRRMSVPLAGLPAGTNALRLTRQPGDLLGPAGGRLRGAPHRSQTHGAAIGEGASRQDRLPEAPDLRASRTTITPAAARSGTRAMAGFYTEFGPSGRPRRRSRRRPGHHWTRRGDSAGVRGRPPEPAAGWTRRWSWKAMAGPRTWTCTRRMAAHWSHYRPPACRVNRATHCTRVTTPATAPGSNGNRVAPVHLQN